ncbi:peptide-methionine (R)-S-oxide reductase [Flavisolibacter nicotianae]|uniref:peptide-methionine (R)-S-oxide reductase n=1 Tax=Flavisolibacter nicotianae TaxID=2364882 RepID=UPI000EB4CCDB
MKNHFTDHNSNEEATGPYVCAACGSPLFDADKQFDAGCGFPSFWQALESGVKQNPLHTYGRCRIQLLCRTCGLHLGHLFQHKHTPTGVRYCINGESIRKTGA